MREDTKLKHLEFIKQHNQKMAEGLTAEAACLALGHSKTYVYTIRKFLKQEGIDWATLKAARPKRRSPVVRVHEVSVPPPVTGQLFMFTGNEDQLLSLMRRMQG